MQRYLILLFLLLTHRVDAQSPVMRIYYADTAHVSGHIYGKCPRIETTADKGYLLRYYMGYPIIDGEGFDYMIELKTDASLQPQWQRKVVYSMTLPDGTLFAVGPNYPYGDTCMLLEKRTASGTVIWQRDLCTLIPGFIRLGEAVYTNSRIRIIGYTVGGYVRDIVVDIDTAGNLLGVDSLTGEPSFAYIENIFADDSGNYYYILQATGTSSLDGRKVAKVRPDNTVAWCSTWNTTFSMNRICGLVRLPGGDVIFAGSLSTSAGDEKGFLLKVSAAGDILWQKTADRHCRPDDIGLMPNGDIAIAAGGLSYTSTSFPSEDDIIITDTGGNVKRAFNVDPDRSAWPHYSGLSLPHVRSANDWLFTALATGPHAPVVFSTDSAGHGQCAFEAVSFAFSDEHIFTSTPATIGFAPMLLSATAAMHATGGTSIPYYDSCDYGMPPSPPASAASVVTAGGYLSFSPNPAGSTVRILNDGIKEVRVMDTWGRVVAIMQAGTKVLDVSRLPQGIYAIHAKGDDGYIYHEKLLVAH